MNEKCLHTPAFGSPQMMARHGDCVQLKNACKMVRLTTFVVCFDIALLILNNSTFTASHVSRRPRARC